jgi:hypothetical protein
VFDVRVEPDPTETFLPNNRATHFLVAGTQQPAGAMSIALSGLQPFGLVTVDPGAVFTVSGTAKYRWANSTNDLPLMGGMVTVTLLGGTWETRTLGDPNSGFFSQAVTAPTAPGDYVVRVTVTDSTLSTYADIQVRVPTPPGVNLGVGSILLDSQVATVPDTVHAYIVNRGGLPTPSTFTSHLKVVSPSGATVFEADAVLAGGLAAGAGAYVSFPGFTPDNVGNYQFTVKADSADAVPETDESDNSLTLSIPIYPNYLDLEVLDVRRECSSVFALVRNNGGLNAAAGFRVAFSDGAGWSATGTDNGVLWARGDSRWVLSGTPYSGSMASHPIRAVASPVAGTDGNAGNNERTVTLVFDDVTDLAVTDLWVNGLRWSGNVVYQDVPATLELEVSNLGCRAGSGTVSFALDGNPIATTQSVTLSAAGSPGSVVTTIPIYHTFLRTLPAGTNYQLQGSVAPASPTVDAVPGNNARTESLTVSPQLPDFQVDAEGITFGIDPALPHPARNEKFGIEAQVCNYGRMAGDVFQVGFYEEGREQIGVVQTITDNVDPVHMPLAVGSCMTVTPRDANGQPVAWGSGFSGNHTILVAVAPVAGVQDDPNDTNNQATKKVWVNHPPIARVAEAGRRRIYNTGDTVTFTAAGSSDDLDLDGRGGIVRYLWNFGDNTFAETTGQTVEHTFRSAGTFRVSLTAVDNNAESSAPASIDSVQAWTFTIAASSGTGGTVSPSGNVTVNLGASQTFAIAANTGYAISGVLVDNVPKGAITSFRFDNVSANHTLSATFVATGFSAVTVLSPNGGEVLPAGSSRTVTWGAPAAAVKFNLSYTTNGSTYTTIATGVAGSSYTWTVPKPAANSTTCRLKVVGTDSTGKTVVGTDTSDANFTIEVVRLTAPNGGGTLKIGSVVPISWTTYGTSKSVTKVTLAYSTNGGSSWTTIASPSGNPGTYNWTVPNIPSSQGRVKVTLYNNSTAVGNDASDSNFTIAP